MSTNSGSKISGIDGVIWLTYVHKMKAVKGLDPDHYRAQSLGRVLIQKKNGKSRSLDGRRGRVPRDLLDTSSRIHGFRNTVRHLENLRRSSNGCFSSEVVCRK